MLCEGLLHSCHLEVKICHFNRLSCVYLNPSTAQIHNTLLSSVCSDIDSSTSQKPSRYYSSFAFSKGCWRSILLGLNNICLMHDLLNVGTQGRVSSSQNLKAVLSLRKNNDELEKKKISDCKRESNASNAKIRSQIEATNKNTMKEDNN